MSDETDHQLARQAGDLLTDVDATVAVAESSTGGLVGSKLTNIPGASAYFDRAVVTYSNRAKLDLLDVDPDTLDTNGAVSAETARQMAHGVRATARTTVGISTTGIAGPAGGSENKPVGTVFIGTAYSDGTEQSVSATRYQFDGSRLECKEQFAEQALQDLIDVLEAREG